MAAESSPVSALQFDTSIKKLFKGVKVTELASKVNLRTVQENTPTSEVLQLLIDAKISSVPLVNAAQAPIANVDVLDLTAFVLACTALKVPDKKNKLRFDASKWKKATAKDVANFSKRNPFVTVLESADLTQTIKALVSVGSGHRAAVVNSSGALVGVVSQGDLVKFFFKHIDEYALAKKTVKELKFGFREVNRSLISETAYEGFERLTRRNVSGIAVVYDDGHTLYGNLSGSDVKHLGANPEKTFKRLTLSIQNFLENHSKQDEAIFVTQGDTISQVAKKFAECHVHRLFVADHLERMNLIGVISLSDILRMLHASASQKRSTGKVSGAKRKDSKTRDRDAPLPAASPKA